MQLRADGTRWRVDDPTGDFIVEMVGEWHRAANIGADSVRLLVIDQVEEGTQNTILQQ